MIWLTPTSITLGTLTLTDVVAVAIDREAKRRIEEHADTGPHLVFADVPEQRVWVRITRRLARSEALPLSPGDSVSLSFRTAPGASASGGRRVTATVVITDIDHSLSASGVATQRISALAVAPDPGTDPVTETEAHTEV